MDKKEIAERLNEELEQIHSKTDFAVSWFAKEI